MQHVRHILGPRGYPVEAKLALVDKARAEGAYAAVSDTGLGSRASIYRWSRREMLGQSLHNLPPGPVPRLCVVDMSASVHPTAPGVFWLVQLSLLVCAWMLLETSKKFYHAHD